MNKIYVPRNKEQPKSLRETPNLCWEHISRRYVSDKNIQGWRELVPEKHWRKGYSAYLLAESWKNANPHLPEEIAALFGYSAKLLVATPEYYTPLKGRGASSRSDVLAFVRTNGKVCAVVVEGKVKESFGSENVDKWLKSGKDPGNRKTRLKFISGELELSCLPDMDLRYQLLHRAASAVIEAKRFKADCAAMIVHSFSDEQKRFCDFERFLKSFGIKCVKSGRLYKGKGEKSGMPLSFGWATSPPSR